MSLKRCFSNYRIYLCILIGVLLLLCEFLSIYVEKFILGKSLGETFSFVFALSICIDYTVLPFVFVALCSLAGGLDFYDDISHNFQHSIRSKMSAKDYIKGRILSSAIIGGITGASLIIIGALLLRSLYPPHTGEYLDMTYFASTGVLNGWGYVFKIAAAYFFCGMAAAVTGLACSSLVANKYIAVLCPLLIFLSILLITNYLSISITPVTLLMSYGMTVSLYQSAYFFILFCIFASVVFAVKARYILEGH